MTRTVASVLLVGCLLMTGCAGVAGAWEATGDPGSFRLAKATFNNDKSYEATSEYEGQEQTSAGNYTYGFWTLSLTPEGDRPARKYRACVSMDGKTLEVSQKGETIKMKKIGCPADCTKDCCKST